MKKLSEEGYTGQGWRRQQQVGKDLCKGSNSIRINGLRRLRGRDHAVRLCNEFPFGETASTWHLGEATGQERFQDQAPKCRGPRGVMGMRGRGL